MLKHLEIKSRARTEFINITSEIQELVESSGIRNGICHLFVLHTTAAVTINEGADPAVQRDIAAFLNKLVPSDVYFTHTEGNSDAHIKSSLMGASQTILVEGGKLVLGTWQAVYLCEFDGPRSRRVAIKITQDP
jgi:secondary thiamine-phosphate synthase enzyme